MEVTGQPYAVDVPAFVADALGATVLLFRVPL
jgi:hypothetical protein